MINAKYVILLLQIVLFMLADTVLAAQTSLLPVTGDGCNVPRSITINRPDPAGEPTEVSIGVYVIDVMEINDVSQSFTADFSLFVRWNDKRLSAKARGTSLAGCRLKPSDIWNPNIVAVNQRKIFKRFEDFVEIDADGTVTYRQRYFGELSSPLSLRKFPFDSQVLPISFVSLYGPEDISFVVAKRWTGRRETFSIAGWSVEIATPLVTTEFVAAQNRDISRFDFDFMVERNSIYYVWRIIVPLALIIFMASTVFWIDPSELGPRVGISTAAVLTLIAFQFTAGRLLPRVSYLTRLDEFTVGSTILVFVALGEAIITSRIAKKGNDQLALKINRWWTFIYPALFFTLVLFTLIM